MREQVNSLVYARVSLAHKDMEPELECFDAQTRKAEGFGELKGGFVVKCSLKMSRLCVASLPSFYYPNPERLAHPNIHSTHMTDLERALADCSTPNIFSFRSSAHAFRLRRRLA
jgi:hypothetical protein